MNPSEVTIGKKVVRSKGDYVVGRVGEIIAIDSEKNRAQVAWVGNPKTWVAFDAIEDESRPYGFTECKRDAKTGRITYPKYFRL
jgi:hypothetical protein